MELTKIEVRKLIASEGKVLVLKEKQYDEEGNEIKQEGSKIIFLAKNSNPEDYIEIDEAREEKESVW